MSSVSAHTGRTTFPAATSFIVYFSLRRPSHRPEDPERPRECPLVRQVGFSRSNPLVADASDLWATARQGYVSELRWESFCFREGPRIQICDCADVQAVRWAASDA